MITFREWLPHVISRVFGACSGPAAGDPASRVLVLDRERVELLLANEFKER